ncbi:hypothetical protein GF402_11125 [Candidatus Fermentibacteria bacterium]|nr:hypothetical protein [Candidatus Fermentibacteria bacterium]
MAEPPSPSPSCCHRGTNTIPNWYPGASTRCFWRTGRTVRTISTSTTFGWSRSRSSFSSPEGKMGRMDIMSRLLVSRVTVLIAAAGIVLAGCGDSTGPSENEEGWNQYSVDDVTFEWMVDDSLAELNSRITAPTSGWVAVGFDPTSFMSEANLIIGYVSAGSTSIRDDFGTGQTSHDADTTLGGTHDIVLVKGSEGSDPIQTQIEFRIPMDSGDDYDKALVEGTTYAVIFAYGSNGADDFSSGHVYAESVSLEI